MIDLLKATGAKANIEVKNLGVANVDFPVEVYEQLSGPLRLQVGFPKSALILIRPPERKLAPVAAGASTVVRQAFRVRRNVKPGRLITLRLRLTGSETPISKTLRIRVSDP